jgi:hypothetical protein
MEGCCCVGRTRNWHCEVFVCATMHIRINKQALKCSYRKIYEISCHESLPPNLISKIHINFWLPISPRTQNFVAIVHRSLRRRFCQWRFGIPLQLLSQFPAFRFDQTGPGAHPVSCKMGNGSLSRGVKLPGCDVVYSPPSNNAVKEIVRGMEF